MSTHEMKETSASKFLENLQGYAYPGAGLVAEMVQTGISKKEFSRICGVNIQYLESIWEGTISLDEVPIDVLRRIASVLKVEPFALMIAAGYLRHCDFYAQGNKEPIQPFEAEWQEWLKSSSRRTSFPQSRKGASKSYACSGDMGRRMRPGSRSREE